MRILHDVHCLFHIEHQFDGNKDSIGRSDWIEDPTDGFDLERAETPDVVEPLPPDLAEPLSPLIWDELGVFGLVDPGKGDPSGAATLSGLSEFDCLGAMGLLDVQTGGPRDRRSLAACSPEELLGALSLSCDDYHD